MQFITARYSKEQRFYEQEQFPDWFFLMEMNPVGYAQSVHQSWFVRESVIVCSMTGGVEINGIIYKNGDVCVLPRKLRLRSLMIAYAEGSMISHELMLTNKRLGGGAHGAIYLGYFGTKVVLKKMHSERSRKMEMEAAQLIGFGGQHVNLMIQFGVVDNMICYEFISSELPHKNLAKLMYQLIGVCSFFVARGICHFDIKPDNLRLAGNIIKVCDFGLARRPFQTANTYGSLIFIRPTSLKTGDYTYANDRWAVMMTYVMKKIPDLYKGYIGITVLMAIANQTRPYEIKEDSDDMEARMFVQWCQRVRVNDL